MSTQNFDASHAVHPQELRAEQAEHDLEQAKRELTAAQNRIFEMEAERSKERFAAKVLELAASQRGSKISPRDLASLLADDVQLGKGGRLISKRPGMSMDETVRSFREVNHYLFEDVTAEAPTAPSAPKDAIAPTAPSPELTELFGKASSGKAANALALKDPEQYRALRAEARKLKLI